MFVLLSGCDRLQLPRVLDFVSAEEDVLGYLNEREIRDQDQENGPQRPWRQSNELE